MLFFPLRRTAVLCCLAISLLGRQLVAQEKIHLTVRSPGVMAFNPDGKTLAVLHYPRQQAITLWDLETQQPKITINDVLMSAFDKLSFSYDGKQLVFRASEVRRIGKDAALCFVDANSGQLVKDMVIKPGNILVDFSEDARFFLTRGTGMEADSRTVTEFATGKRTVLKGEKTTRTTDVLSPDGSLVMSAEYFNEAPKIRLRVWEGATGKLRHTISHKDWIELPNDNPGLTISPDNKIVAVYGLPHLTLRFFNLDTGKELGKVASAYGKAIWPALGPDVVFLRDSKHIAIVSSEEEKDHHLDIWNVAELKKVKTLTGTQEKMGARTLAISPDGRYIARSSSHSSKAPGSISIWEVPKLEP